MVAVAIDDAGDEVGGPRGYLDDLFVDPDVRRGGAVDALFAEINRLAVESDWPVVRWTTADDNYRARSVYDSAPNGSSTT